MSREKNADCGDRTMKDFGEAKAQSFFCRGHNRGYVAAHCSVIFLRTSREDLKSVV